MGFEGDDDAGVAVVVEKLEFGVVGVGKAGALGVSLDVVTALGATKELLLEGAFEGIAADAELNGGASGKDDGQEGEGGKEPPGCCHTSIVPRQGGRGTGWMGRGEEEEKWERLQDVL